MRALSLLLAVVAVFGSALNAGTPAKRPGAAKASSAKAGPAKKPAPPVALAVPAFDEQGLVDWQRQPFSDLASRGVLWRRDQGLLAWRLGSALAFGSVAAQPHAAKDLVDWSLELVVEGEPQPRFAAQALSFSSRPFWAEEQGQDGPLRVEAATLFSATDVVVAAANVRNASDQPLRLRPRLRLHRSAEGLGGAKALQPASAPELVLSLDRSAAAGRRLVEHVAVRLGGQSGRTAWTQPGGLKPLAVGAGADLEPGRALDLELTWPVTQRLAPGQVLRVPVLLAWGTDMAAVQARAQEQWRTQALPAGEAWRTAKARWDRFKARLPLAPEPGRQRLLARAALDLARAEYAPRQALAAPAFSAHKGRRDAFDGIDSVLACLGWAELDLPKAQAALLELASFSAAAPAPVPPHTGDEKLAWEAAGLPLHGLAAWELYHRDPQAPRAGAFLARFGERLRNESAWWPEARDGDGNGLYAFARREEMPPYLRRGLGPAPRAGEEDLSLQPWSLALSALVAWQMQAAAALAEAAGSQEEAAGLLDRSQRIRQALQEHAWDPEAGLHRQGLESMWLLWLGLEEDAQRRQAWFRHWVPALQAGQRPWEEQGVATPWRFYYLMRTLASYGYFELEQELTRRFLDEMERIGLHAAEYGPDPGQVVGGSAATAAVVSQLILKRQHQDVFLTDETGPFEAPFIQFRTLDGAFYLKRHRLPERRAVYAPIKVEVPKNGKILEEKAFILSAPETLAIQIQSEWPMDISDLNRQGALIFKQSRRVELLVQPRTRIQVRFFPPQASKEGV